MPRLRLHLAAGAGFALGLCTQVFAQSTVSAVDCKSDGMTPPAAANNHAASQSDYPLLSLETGEQGTTVLAFTIREDGATADIHVEKSSGFARLDDASVALAKNWLYKPATANGKPMACLWQAGVIWRIDYSVKALAAAGIPFLHPDPSDYPAGTPVTDQEAVTVLAVAIRVDGSVASMRVSQSAGSSALDNAAMAYVIKKMHFAPATVNGKPVASSTIVAVDWSPADKK